MRELTSRVLGGGALALGAAFMVALAAPACGDSGAPIEDDDDSGPAEDSADESSETGPNIVCTPLTVRCAGMDTLETCAPTGLEWEQAACPANTQCAVCESDQPCEQDRCIGECDASQDLPSSAGCEFIANRQLHLYPDWPDGLVIANPNDEGVANVQIFFTPEGTFDEGPVGDLFSLDPGQAETVSFHTDFIEGNDSLLRTGGIYRIASDLPVIAYQHAPLDLNRGNDSSMLLPTSALGQDYVVMSYPANQYFQGAARSYFVVVATENNTTVRWTPRANTAGNGVPIPFVEAGQTGEITLNRFDTLRVMASANDVDDRLARDVSGTVISSDAPIWVVGASSCASVPILGDPDADGLDNLRSSTCDPIQEVMLPLQHWGKKYVAPAFADRDVEDGDEPAWNHWRIYGGAEDVHITSTPDVVDYTFSERGEYIDISVEPGVNILLEGDGPFMPVGLIQTNNLFSDDGAGGTDPEISFGDPNGGDPAMSQMVPVEQFLSRYVFSKAKFFFKDYVTVIRAAEGPDVILQGTAIPNGDFQPIGDHEVAIVELTDDEDSYLIESEQPFGIIQHGFSDPEPNLECQNTKVKEDGSLGECNSSYAYPGGMKAEVINIP